MKYFRQGVLILAVFGCPWSLASGTNIELRVEKKARGYLLKTGPDRVFHQSFRPMKQWRVFDLEKGKAYAWEELLPGGKTQHLFSVPTKDGQPGPVTQSTFAIKLRYDQFDPLRRVPDALEIDNATGPFQVYMVQFHTKTLEHYREAITNLGGTVRQYLPQHTHLVQMNQTVAAKVADLPYVRWVGIYRPEYRLEPYLLENRANASAYFPFGRYNIQIFDAALEAKNLVAQRLTQLGGTVHVVDFGKYLIAASLTPDQLFTITGWDEVLYVDRWSPPEYDMDNVRELGGANALETVEGFTGQGVRGEVLDGGFNTAHMDFQATPLIEHTAVSGDSHGAGTSGICFGDGAGNATARGLLPDGQGIIADSSVVFTGVSRYNHTGELLEDPYFAVFQTSSVGSSRILDYTSISADIDAMLFDFGVLHCQSQSNARNRYSRPQAWAKNIVSGGAFRHFNTLDTSDDCWDCVSAGTGSIGPAADGRIKPDLSFFYDSTFTTSFPGATAYQQFGGTSGATPSICGYFGLFFQMWSEGIFGNPTLAGASVFDNRSKMTTAKAMMINSANPYAFSGAAHDFSRTHQGWGVPDMQRLYDQRDQYLIVDETRVLSLGESALYPVTPLPGESLRATLVFLDPPGVPAASESRVNDLTLKLIAPDGTVYWGNHGLVNGNESTAGGSPNTIDTVENVWLSNPMGGTWMVEVLADEINQDGHVETGALDADFALVVSGIEVATPDLIMATNGQLPQSAPSNTPVPVELLVRPGSGPLDPGSVNLHYRSGSTGPFNVTPMNALGGDLFQGTLPGGFCSDDSEYYFSAKSNGATFTYPSQLPAQHLSLAIGEDTVVFEDDFEADQGWTVGSADDDASAGVWERIQPRGIKSQPVQDHTPQAGNTCFITEQELDWFGNSNSYVENDVDGGQTTLTSPVFDLSGGDATVGYWRWYSNDTRLYRAGYMQDDVFQVDISNDGGMNWVNVETIGPTGPGTSGGWLYHEFRVGGLLAPTGNMQVRFVASDQGSESNIEAGVDDFRVFDFACSESCGTEVFMARVADWPDVTVTQLLTFICDP